MSAEAGVVEWLLEGDPAIRWQALRDLCDRPDDEWQAERRRTLDTGWGAEFLAHLLADGSWPDGRWTGSVWTLCTLIDLGLPPDHAPLRAAAGAFLDRNLPPEADAAHLLKRMDLCHIGFWLRIGAYFHRADPRLHVLIALLLGVQMADGGWNCRIRTERNVRHSSFHTTFNVLEGLSAAADAGRIDTGTFRESERRALEFMLAHQMYRSDRTGEIVQERFTHLTYPSHWHYTVLRGLDYLSARPEIADPRLDDPIVLIERQRNANGRWRVEKRIPGDTLVEMERMGGDSRWNTLRAQRVLRRRSATLGASHSPVAHGLVDVRSMITRAS